jgi:hypothetical protein
VVFSDNVLVLIDPCAPSARVPHGFIEATVIYPPWALLERSQISFVEPISMFAPDPLERLRVLNISSADFPDQTWKILRGKEYQECIPSLRGETLTWLVECLDNVCLRILYLLFVQRHCRSSTISIQPTLLSRTVLSSSESYVALGRCYQRRPQFQTL